MRVRAPGVERTDTPDGAGWPALADLGTGATGALAGLSGVLLTDVEGLALAAVIGGALVWHRWRGSRWALAVMGLLLVNVGYWSATATVSAIAHDDALGFTALSAAQSVLVVVGLVGVVGTWIRAVAPPLVARSVVLVAVGMFVAVTGVAVVPGVGDGVEVLPGDILVGARDTRYDPADVEIAAGRSAVVVKNHDYFWHTWTVDELGVDIRLPVGATRRATFRADAGEYEIVCTIPGHEQAGMTGTLVVR